MPSKELTIFRVHMKEALAAARKGEGELAILYQEVANDVTAKVEARGDRVSAVELEGAINEAFEKTAFKRIRIVRTSIENAAKLGPKASKKTMRAVYGEEVARAQVRSSKKAVTEAAERIAGRTTVDGVALTKRMRKVDRSIASEMAREVEKGIRQKKGILGAARQIEKLDPREVRLPQYLQKVETAARGGNLDELKKLTAGYTGHVKRMLGEHQADGSRIASKFSLRSATQRFLKDVEKAGPKGVDKVVKRYVTEKAAWRANVIARHESVEAYRRSYIEQSKNKPGVIGMAWHLSPTRHPVPDECDIYAHQNAYKLGPGVYPADKVPHHPHPLCLCSVTVVLDKHHFKRGQAANDNAVPPLLHDGKSPDALGWLKANDSAAAKILGPTRHALMKQGVNVLDGEGKPLLVRDLLGTQRVRMAVGSDLARPPVSLRPVSRGSLPPPVRSRTRGTSNRRQSPEPRGATGPAERWEGLDERLAGGPVRQLSTAKVRVTPRGVNVVERHLSRFDSSRANDTMLERLRQIAAGTLAPTSQDRNYYTHELREYVRYRRRGFLEGVPDDKAARRDLWLHTHSATLADYNLPLRSDPSLYHPTALRLLGED